MVEVSGCVQSGPSPVLASGVLIIASGPALCSPLKGVGFCGLKPQSAAAFGSSNQKPTLKVPVGASATVGSKLKLSSSRIVRMSARNPAAGARLENPTDTSRGRRP